MQFTPTTTNSSISRFINNQQAQHITTTTQAEIMTNARGNNGESKKCIELGNSDDEVMFVGETRAPAPPTPRDREIVVIREIKKTPTPTPPARVAPPKRFVPPGQMERFIPHRVLPPLISSRIPIEGSRPPPQQQNRPAPRPVHAPIPTNLFHGRRRRTILLA